MLNSDHLNFHLFYKRGAVALHRLQSQLLPFGNSESSFCVTYREDDRNLKLTVCVAVQDRKKKS